MIMLLTVYKCRYEGYDCIFDWHISNQGHTCFGVPRTIDDSVSSFSDAIQFLEFGDAPASTERVRLGDLERLTRPQVE